MDKRSDVLWCSVMSFDPFVAIVAMYSAVLCASLAVLFWAFKGAFNPSGRFFVLSEASRIPVLLALIVVHLDTSLNGSFAIFVVSPFYIFSEISFVFSLRALPSNYAPAHFIKLQFIVALLCGALEAIRFHFPDLHLALYLMLLCSINASAIWICAQTNDEGLRDAPFWKMLKYVETFFLTISVVRLALLMSGITVTPTESGSANTILVSMMLTLLIFRSYCYQSVWMTWASPHATENRLNRNLLKTLHEREILLQKVSASNRRLSVNALAASLAHQLSQPLTGAALQAEAAKKKLSHLPGAVEAFHGLEKVTEILRNVSGIVINLRSLFGSKNEALEKIELSRLCREAVNLVDFSVMNVPTKINVLGEIRSEIIGNQIQIQQVILNLIDNGIQACRYKDDGKINIILAEEEKRVSLTVRDNGRGFDADRLENMFDLYSSTKEGGTGIGLWLCRQIVEKHKGSISAFNHPEGGACVRIEFPALGASV